MKRPLILILLLGVVISGAMLVASRFPQPGKREVHPATTGKLKNSSPSAGMGADLPANEKAQAKVPAKAGVAEIRREFLTLSRRQVARTVYYDNPGERREALFPLVQVISQLSPDEIRSEMANLESIDDPMQRGLMADALIAALSTKVPREALDLANAFVGEGDAPDFTVREPFVALLAVDRQAALDWAEQPGNRKWGKYLAMEMAEAIVGKDRDYDSVARIAALNPNGAWVSSALADILGDEPSEMSAIVPHLKQLDPGLQTEYFGRAVGRMLAAGQLTEEMAGRLLDALRPDADIGAVRRSFQGGLEDHQNRGGN